MEQYSSIIFCSDRAFKAVIMVLSISLVMILSFLFLHAHSFAYLGMNENVHHLIYDHNSSSLRPFISELGTESKNNNNWITVNHDIYGSRSSNQTVIKKDNVATLQVKWRIINDVEIQDPPIVEPF